MLKLIYRYVYVYIMVTMLNNNISSGGSKASATRYGTPNRNLTKNSL